MSEVWKAKVGFQMFRVACMPRTSGAGPLTCAIRPKRAMASASQGGMRNLRTSGTVRLNVRTRRQKCQHSPETIRLGMLCCPSAEMLSLFQGLSCNHGTLVSKDTHLFLTSRKTTFSRTSTFWNQGIPSSIILFSSARLSRVRLPVLVVQCSQEERVSDDPRPG